MQLPVNSSDPTQLKMLRIVVWCIILSIVVSLSAKSDEGEEISIFDRGRVLHVKAGTPELKQLLRTSEDALISAGNMFRLSVLPEMIKGLRSTEVSVEISYNKPKSFTLAPGGRVIRVDRIFIPLTGSYAETASGETFVTVFYGLGGYSSGPYSNTGEYHNNLMAVVEKVLKK